MHDIRSPVQVPDMIMRLMTGYPDEYRKALHPSQFDIQIVKTRHRDAYSVQTRGALSQTDRAFAIAVLLENEPMDHALDTLEQTRNMLLGRAYEQQERGGTYGR